MDRRGGAGALAVPAWPSMARPGARSRSGEGVGESAFFRVVCKGVGWAFNHKEEERRQEDYMYFFSPPAPSVLDIAVNHR